MIASEEFTVHDLQPEAATDMLENGAIWADTPAEVAHGKDLIVTCLPMLQHVDAVSFGVYGIAEGGDKSTVVINCTLNSFDMVRYLDKRYTNQDIAFLDTPVSGGVIRAMNRDLTAYVGSK